MIHSRRGQRILRQAVYPLGKHPLKLGLQTKMATEITEGLSTDDRLILFPDDHLPHIGRKAEVREP